MLSWSARLRDYFNDMKCCVNSDISLIQRKALRVFGSPKRFNNYIASVHRGEPLQAAPAYGGPTRIIGLRPRGMTRPLLACSVPQAVAGDAPCNEHFTECC